MKGPPKKWCTYQTGDMYFGRNRNTYQPLHHRNARMTWVMAGTSAHWISPEHRQLLPHRLPRKRGGEVPGAAGDVDQWVGSSWITFNCLFNGDVNQWIHIE